MNEDNGSILLSNEIEKYVRERDLINPFNPKQLKPASYRLSIGDECAIGGEYKKLEDSPGKNEINIPPFNVAIIKTQEFIKMPRNLIGRWNIRVTLAYKGLLWVGGPQVDPGYEGNLFCPIYNLSAELVTLKMKDTIATIDFCVTTPYHEDKSLKFEQKRRDFKDYDFKLKSALLTKVGDRLDKIDIKMTNLEEKTTTIMNTLSKKLDFYVGVMITIIGLIIATISVFITSGQQSTDSINVWIVVSVIVSILALTFSISALISTRNEYDSSPWG